MKKVIVISGKAGAGKDTFGHMLELDLTRCGFNVLTTHYADLLKYMCRTLFGWDGMKDEAGRSLLQYVGTDVIRKQEPDFWVGFVAKVLELFPNEWDYVIIPDCRFPNEIQYMKDRGFDVIHIQIIRPDNNILTDAQSQHASETALDDVKPDYVIVNDGTTEKLHSSYRIKFDDNGVIQL